jgi:hypothetical protein
MTSESEVSANAPSDDASDIVKSVEWYAAQSVFMLNIQRIETLLQIARSGMDHDIERMSELQEKFSNASPGPTSVRHLKNGLVEINLTQDDVDIVQKAISYRSEFVASLPFYLHNVLLVAAWSALEGYVQALLAELYTQYPNLLSSEKKVTVSEVVGSSENIIAYLVAKEIDDIGRKNFTDLQSYLKSKIKLQFSNKHVEALHGAYFLRNVIAHAAGFLRDEQLGLVPKGVDTEGSELRISQEYLNNLINCIREPVLKFDRNVRTKFSPTERVTLRPDALQEPESHRG